MDALAPNGGCSGSLPEVRCPADHDNSYDRRPQGLLTEVVGRSDVAAAWAKSKWARYCFSMVKAPSSRRISRALVPSRLPRVLTLAVLLFGVVFAHGMNAESSKGHLSASAAFSLTDQALGHGTAEARFPLQVVETDGQHDGHCPAHSADRCVAGQPGQGSAGACSCSAGSVRELATPAGSSLLQSPTDVDFHGAWAVAMRSSTIQQI